MHKKNQQKAILLFLSFVIGLGQAWADGHNEDAKASSDTLVFSYWNQATPPFVFTQNGELKGGIIKDLGDAIVSKLKKTAKYVELPVGRVEPHLRSGQVDAVCVTSPIWNETPDQYAWSPILFQGADRFLIRNETNFDITNFNDLKGLSVGIYNGYTYHPDIMQMIENNEFKAFKVKNVEKGIELLLLKRIDVLIDFGVLLKYQLLKQDLNDTLRLATAHADDFELSCAYSKKSHTPPQEMDSAIKSLIESGKVNTILSKYR